jgi:putative heme-binding domain-containing protein
LAATDSPEVATLVLNRWDALTPALRRRAGDVLVSRNQWIGPLLAAIQSGDIAPADLEPGRLQLLAAHDDETIRAAAARILAERINSNRAAVLAAYRDVPTLDGKPERGLEVFRRHCAACHQHEGLGHAIGPSLAAMRARGAEAILTALLDPNREVNPQYLNYTLVTLDGRVLNGMIESESATTIELRRAEGAGDTVLRIDIDQLKSTAQSLMPEGLEKEIDREAMADLLAYLLGQ